MKLGDKVTVVLYGGQQATRVVLEEGADFVVVCLEEEYRKANERGQSAQGVGFPKRYVVSDATVS